MANDISGFGLQINLTASNTFPQGLIVSQFADDADPIDGAAIPIADAAMGLNGDLVTWSKATPIPVTISVIPNSDDDQNLSILAEANRVGKGKTSAQDIISIQGVYPDGTLLTLTGGKLTEAPILSSVASAGRMKSKTYAFKFENKTGG